MHVGEITSNCKRALFTSIVNCGFNIGGYVYIYQYKYTDGWRLVFTISAIATFITGILFYFYAEESPRFWIIKKDYKSYIRSIQKMAFKNRRLEIFNKFYISEESNIKERFNAEFGSDNGVITTNSVSSVATNSHISSGTDEVSIDDDKTQRLLNELKNMKYSPLDLLRYKSVRYKFIILSCLWFLISSNYYGITFNLKNLQGDVYTLGMIMNTVDIVAYTSGGFISNFIGRKLTILASLSFAIITFGINFFIPLSDTLSNILSFIARFGISLIYNLMCTYSLELYPTVVRSYGFGYNTVFESIGVVIIPTVIEYLIDYLNLIFMIVNIFNFIIVLYLPETLNKPLADFIPELLERKGIIMDNDKVERLIVKSKPEENGKNVIIGNL